MLFFLSTLGREIVLRTKSRLIGTERSNGELAAFLAKDLKPRRVEITALLPLVTDGAPRDLHTRAQIAMERGDFNAARMHLEQLGEIQPAINKDIGHLTTLARACIECGCIDRALILSHIILDLNEDAHTPFELMQIPLIAHHRHDEIIKLFARSKYKGRIWPYGSHADFENLQSDAIDRGVPSVFIAALPKSASTFIARTLEASTNAPSCNIGLPTFPHQLLVPKWLEAFQRGGAIAVQHTDAAPENLTALIAHGVSNIAVHIRDPRQAILSWTRYLDKCLSAGDTKPMNVMQTPKIPGDYVYWDDHAKLDWQIKNYLPQMVTWIVDWLDLAANSPANLNVKVFTFEDFIEDQTAYFSELTNFLQLPNETLKSIERSADNNYRKGLTDEWRTIFSSSQAQLANDILGKKLATYFN